MSIYEELKHFSKDYIYEQYIKIVEDPKYYENITKIKMIDAICKIYSNPDNIIDICTIKELKYLKMVIDNLFSLADGLQSKEKIDIKYFSHKYDWERKTLQKKFLLTSDFYGESTIPFEIKDSVKKALEKIKWSSQRKINELNEILIGYCKIQGIVSLDVLCEFASNITDLTSDAICNHIFDNKLLNYYVYITMVNKIKSEEQVTVAIFRENYEFASTIEDKRDFMGLVENLQITAQTCKSIFYNDFDIYNPKVKKLLTEIKKFPSSCDIGLEEIREYALLSWYRKPLEEKISNLSELDDAHITKFLKILNEALDEMPSGVLGGYTPNQVGDIRDRQVQLFRKKDAQYKKQTNAHLSIQDANLFNKIYFALLEYTNKKYKINKNFKIYKCKKENSDGLMNVIEKFWKEKETIILEFCKVNPYKFSPEELEFASELKKGMRREFIIARYELDYTAFMVDDRIYMVKGLQGNIDKLIPYECLPFPVMTTIIPFRGNLIYDGIIQGINKKMSIEFEEMVEREYDNLMKYYYF